jgi:hypothetical protein
MDIVLTSDGNRLCRPDIASAPWRNNVGSGLTGPLLPKSGVILPPETGTPYSIPQATKERLKNHCGGDHFAQRRLFV